MDGCSATLAGGDVETYDGLVDGEEEERVLVERAEAEGDAVLARVVARDLRQFGVAASVEPERRLVARLLRPEPRPPPISIPSFLLVFPFSFFFHFHFQLSSSALSPAPIRHRHFVSFFFLFRSLAIFFSFSLVFVPVPVPTSIS